MRPGDAFKWNRYVSLMEYKFIKLSGKSLGNFFVTASAAGSRDPGAGNRSARPVMTGFKQRLVKSCHNGIILDGAPLLRESMVARASGSRQLASSPLFYKRKSPTRVSNPPPRVSDRHANLFYFASRRDYVLWFVWTSLLGSLGLKACV